MTSRSCSTPGHDWRRERRDAAARNIVANLLQARVGETVPEWRREIIITPLPLYHIFSLTANCLVFMTLGAENVLIPIRATSGIR
jgi:acyl-CoA synthetase (AMP-forming)/AMP-acid ligase II